MGGGIDQLFVVPSQPELPAGQPVARAQHVKKLREVGRTIGRQQFNAHTGRQILGSGQLLKFSIDGLITKQSDRMPASGGKLPDSRYSTRLQDRFAGDGRAGFDELGCQFLGRKRR